MGDGADGAEQRALFEEENVELAECGTCGAPMRWERTVRGKPIPLDPQPVPGAHLFITVPSGRVADDRSQEAHPGAERFTTHFATCPDAHKHRRPR